MGNFGAKPIVHYNAGTEEHIHIDRNSMIMTAAYGALINISINGTPKAEIAGAYHYFSVTWDSVSKKWMIIGFAINPTASNPIVAIALTEQDDEGVDLTFSSTGMYTVAQVINKYGE